MFLFSVIEEQFYSVVFGALRPATLVIVPWLLVCNLLSVLPSLFARGAILHLLAGGVG